MVRRGVTTHNQWGFRVPVCYMTWHDMTWHDMTWHGMAWHGKVWYGKAWHDMTWHHGVSSVCLCTVHSIVHSKTMLDRHLICCTSISGSYPLLSSSRVVFTQMGRDTTYTRTCTLRKDVVILQLYWWLFSSTKHCSWNMVQWVVILQSYFPSYNV